MELLGQGEGVLGGSSLFGPPLDVTLMAVTVTGRSLSGSLQDNTFQLFSDDGEPPLKTVT